MNSLIIIILCTAFIVSLTTYLIVRVYTLKRKLKSLNNENEVLTQTVRKDEELFEKVKKRYVDPYETLCQGLDTVVSENNPILRARALQKVMQDSLVWSQGDNADTVKKIFVPMCEAMHDDKNMKIIKMLHQLIDGFYNNDLNLEVRYLNEYDKQRIRTNLLRLCLMLMDGCQCIGDYFNYVESEQGVNRMLIEGQVNLAEAETRCRPITDLDTETPRWARTLKAALEPWLHNEADGIMPQTTLILRGFCLQ